MIHPHRGGRDPARPVAVRAWVSFPGDRWSFAGEGPGRGGLPRQYAEWRAGMETRAAIARSDGELVEACRAGDARAWSDLVDRYGRLVFSIPSRFGLSTPACEDVFQEVFVTALRKLPSLRDERSLPKWLMTVAQHLTCRWLSHNQRPAAGLAREVPQTPPESELARWERQHVVREALDELGGNCRELLEALFLDRSPLGYEEISRRLNMPVGSIGPTRNRCLRKLLKILEVRGTDGVL